jgi:HD-GYP domain-containing protein (c-di-GMP phosphodiesterase class II)
LAEIKGTDPDRVVLMITGFSETEAVIEALRLGTDDYLLKIELQQLEAAAHARRVATLCEAFADAIHHTTQGRYRRTRFPPIRRQRLRYAALLHDLGRLAVSPEILAKSTKLYDHEMVVIETRLILAQRTAQWKTALAQLEHWQKTEGLPDEWELRALDDEGHWTASQVQADWEANQRANQPGPLDPSTRSQIEALTQQTYADLAGKTRPLLEPEKARLLLQGAGTLGPQERAEIQAAAEKTHEILSGLPWVQSLATVPLLATAATEWIDGSGYPWGLQGQDIPLESKMIAIANLYETVTTPRPHKPPQPPAQAVRLLAYEAEAGHFDAELVRIFREAEVFRALQE